MYYYTVEIFGYDAEYRFHRSMSFICFIYKTASHKIQFQFQFKQSILGLIGTTTQWANCFLEPVQTHFASFFFFLLYPAAVRSEYQSSYCTVLSLMPFGGYLSVVRERNCVVKINVKLEIFQIHSTVKKKYQYFNLHVDAFVSPFSLK